MKKTAFVVCFSVLAASAVAIEVCPAPPLSKEILAKEKKWVIIPTHVNDAEGRPYLMKALLHSTEVCGIMIRREDQSWCYAHWEKLEYEPWPLQNDEAELYADPEQTMLIRITEEVLCKMMNNEQRLSFPTPNNNCHKIFEKAAKEKKN